jgi:glycosyltransferase involved in cell wall biosynthesis
MKKLLIIADITCSKQTFVSRANSALIDAGFDYRMIFTRGEWSNPETDRPVSKRINYELKPRYSDVFHLPRVATRALLSKPTRQFLSSTTSFEFGRRLAISSAVINYHLLQGAKRWQPDVILAHFLWNLKIAIGLGNALNIPVMCIAHGSDVLIDKIWLKHVNDKQVSRIFCVSHALKNKIDETFPSLVEKTTVLYSPISSLYLEAPIPVAATHIKVVCVAALRELKNHAWLFRALRLLKDAGVTFECKLIGEPLPGNPRYRDLLKNLVHDLGLDDTCSFLGWLSPLETKDLIDKSTVLVLPSRSEGLPTVIVESIARQRYPVGTDIPSIREAMLGGKYGILCPPDDDLAFSKAIQEAHQRTTVQSAEMVEGRRKIAELFSVQRYGELVSLHINQVVEAAKGNLQNSNSSS